MATAPTYYLPREAPTEFYWALWVVKNDAQQAAHNLAVYMSITHVATNTVRTLFERRKRERTYSNNTQTALENRVTEFHSDEVLRRINDEIAEGTEAGRQCKLLIAEIQLTGIQGLTLDMYEDFLRD